MNNRMDREQMIFQLLMNTKFSEVYLKNLPYKDLERLYIDKIEKE